MHGTAVAITGMAFGLAMVIWNIWGMQKRHNEVRAQLREMKEKAGYLHQRLLAISELPGMWLADADGRSSVDYAAALQECARDLSDDLKRHLAPEGE